MKFTKKHIAEILIVLLVIAVIYNPLKFLLRGTLPHLPEGGGIDSFFILGTLFMVLGVGMTLYYVQTPRIEALKSISLGILFITGFMLVHLSMSGYQYPVSVMPLDISDGGGIIQNGGDYSFLALPLSLLGVLVSVLNLATSFLIK